MAKRKVYGKNEEILRKKSKVVSEINNRIIELLDDMAETMYDYDGCGLAAPQVGVLKRIVVVDDGEGLIEMINPKIVDKSDERELGVEGCLSAPGIFGEVERPYKVVCDYIDRDGNPMQIEAEGFLARIICHEVAHLEGQLFLDIANKILTKEELEKLREE